MNFENTNRLWMINAAAGQAGPVQPATQEQQPTAPNPSSSYYPQTPSQPSSGTQAPPNPAMQSKTSTPAEAEDSELDLLLQKGEIEKVKTVKVAEKNLYIRVYAKKTQPVQQQSQPSQPQSNQSQPQPEKQPQQPQSQSVQTGPKIF